MIVARAIVEDVIFDPIRPAVLYPMLDLNNKIRPVADNNMGVWSSNDRSSKDDGRFWSSLHEQPILFSTR